MGYRDEVDALRARRDYLRASDGDRAELARVEREIEETRKHLSVLSRIRVASPCKASWEAMVGDERSRHCALCEKHVYDFSGLTAAECLALIDRTEGGVCARFYRRKDGTILTADCERGRTRARRQAVLFAGGLFAASAAAAASMMVEGETRVVSAESVDDVGSFELDESAFLDRPNAHVNDPAFSDHPVPYDLVMGMVSSHLHDGRVNEVPYPPGVDRVALETALLEALAVADQAIDDGSSEVANIEESDESSGPARP